MKMQDFIYEYYGIYPNFDYGLHFIQDQFHYELFLIDNEELILKMLKIIQQIEIKLKSDGYKIVQNKYGSFTSKGHVLFCYIPRLINLDELCQMNQINLGSVVDLNQVRDKWVNKLEFISRRYLQLLDLSHHHYEQYCVMTKYYLGLGETAIAYLVDLLFDQKQFEINKYLVHQRIKIFSFEEIFNPLNFFEGSRIRDLVELYKNQIIHIDQVKKYIDFYQFNRIEIHYFMARSIFPNYFFDLIEEEYFKENYNQKNILNFYHKINLDLFRIKELYYLLNQYYPLRPIPWILKD